jgi:hypothetical protein
LRRPPLLAWWALWLGAPVLAMLGIAADNAPALAWTFHVLAAAGQAIDAVLAVIVVRRIDARLAERARRMAPR